MGVPLPRPGVRLVAPVVLVALLAYRRWDDWEPPAAPPRNPRVAIVTAFVGTALAPLAAVSRPFKERHAARNDYSLFDAASPSFASEFGPDASAFEPPPPSAASTMEGLDAIYAARRRIKLRSLRAVLASGRFDWVAWTDADHAFLKPSFSFSAAGLLDPRWDLVLPSASHHSAKWHGIPNLGFTLLRRDPWTLSLLDALLDMSSRPCNRTALAGTRANGWLELCTQEGRYWLGDQGLLMAYLALHPGEACRARRIPIRAAGGLWPCVKPGDPAVHFAGAKDPGKAVRMLHALDAHARRDPEGGVPGGGAGEMGEAKAAWEKGECEGAEDTSEVRARMEADWPPCDGRRR